MIGEMITLFGAVLVLLAAIGVVRLPDALTRLHALTKASTIGVAFVAIGAAFVLTTANDVTSALGAAILQLLTLPVSASLIARSTYLAQGIRAASTPSTSSPTAGPRHRTRGAVSLDGLMAHEFIYTCHRLARHYPPDRTVLERDHHPDDDVRSSPRLQGC